MVIRILLRKKVALDILVKDVESEVHYPYSWTFLLNIEILIS
jgi:hypothetical protein